MVSLNMSHEHELIQSRVRVEHWSKKAGALINRFDLLLMIDLL